MLCNVLLLHKLNHFASIGIQVNRALVKHSFALRLFLVEIDNLLRNCVLSKLHTEHLFLLVDVLKHRLPRIRTLGSLAEFKLSTILGQLHRRRNQTSLLCAKDGFGVFGILAFWTYISVSYT